MPWSGPDPVIPRPWTISLRIRVGLAWPPGLAPSDLVPVHPPISRALALLSTGLVKERGGTSPLPSSDHLPGSFPGDSAHKSASGRPRHGDHRHVPTTTPVSLPGSLAEASRGLTVGGPDNPAGLHDSIRASFLREEIDALLTKGAVEPVPPADMERGFYSPYFLVPKKAGGLRPILDLRRLNRHLAKYRFKMLTVRCILPCIRPGDWFATIDLKDAYFQVEVVPRHRPFLRFCFQGHAYQYKVLPFGLALSPRTFTKVVRAALAPLRRAGIRILDYLDDWLLIASSRDQLIRHQGKVLSHLNRLGLKVNWEKSHLTPVRVISFLGMELNSESMLARLSVERTRALLTALFAVSSRPVVRLKLIQRLLGHMSAAAPVIRLGLLRMRPLQQWLLSRVPSWAWRQGALRLEDGVLLRSGVPLSSHPNRVVVTTDASKTGWGAVCGSHRESDHSQEATQPFMMLVTLMEIRLKAGVFLSQDKVCRMSSSWTTMRSSVERSRGAERRSEREGERRLG
ncbi:hypothetical protein DNTS_016476 [Danionella cerebrum]|uniref:ribonuclease H n=1 Tax=Danionella cerebrum TaxID=2873325 RepID=A0A553QT20_9TELE|nr:hypothetical protein DNTS_016476 [Danionella translucida]